MSLFIWFVGVFIVKIKQNMKYHYWSRTFCSSLTLTHWLRAVNFKWCAFDFVRLWLQSWVIWCARQAPRGSLPLVKTNDHCPGLHAEPGHSDLSSLNDSLNRVKALLQLTWDQHLVNEITQILYCPPLATTGKLFDLLKSFSTCSLYIYIQYILHGGGICMVVAHPDIIPRNLIGQTLKVWIYIYVYI